jgi:hypothetical protein
VLGISTPTTAPSSTSYVTTESDGDGEGEGEPEGTSEDEAIFF